MDPSADKSEFTVIRIGESYTGNWPAEVRSAIAVLTGYVETALADEAQGAGQDPADQQSGSALREAAEREAAKRSEAETTHPGRLGGDDPLLHPRGSICGAVDAAEPASGVPDPEIILVRGRNAYAVVDQALG